jgi:hypothetical protein
VQYHPLPTSTDDGWDAVSEIWFDNVSEMHTAFGESEYLTRVRPDELFLARLDAGFALTVEEAPLWRAPATSSEMQIFGFLRRRGDLTRDEFVKYWRETHGPLVSELPGVRDVLCEYTHNLVASVADVDPMNTGFESSFAFDGAITAKATSATAVLDLIDNPLTRHVFQGDAQFADVPLGLQLIRAPQVIYAGMH